MSKDYENQYQRKNHYLRNKSKILLQVKKALLLIEDNNYNPEHLEKDTGLTIANFQEAMAIYKIPKSSTYYQFIAKSYHVVKDKMPQVTFSTYRKIKNSNFTRNSLRKIKKI